MSEKKLILQEAERFFEELFGGAHHIPSKIKEFGEGWCVFLSGDVSTFDSNLMTRIVFLAHGRCVRAELSRAGMKLRLAIHKRKREGGMAKRHPTIEQALIDWRGSQ